MWWSWPARRRRARSSWWPTAYPTWALPPGRRRRRCAACLVSSGCPRTWSRPRSSCSIPSPLPVTGSSIATPFRRPTSTPTPRRLTSTGHQPPGGTRVDGLVQLLLGRRNRIGFHYNFFERGGRFDSLSLQVVARAAKAAWKITPRQIFEQATLEQLARVAAPLDSPDVLPASATIGTISAERIDEPQLAPVVGGRPLIEDVYTLAPLQAGMSFHVLASTEPDLYLEQLHGVLTGAVTPTRSKPRGSW